MARTLVFLGALLCLLHLTRGVDFDLCHDENDLGLQKVELEPERISPGEPVVITITGTTKTDISDNSGDIDVKATVKAFGAKVGEAKLDFCSDLRGIACPLAAGTAYTATATWNVPDVSLPGLDLDIKVEVKSEDKTYGCFEIEVELDNRRLARFSSSGSSSSSLASTTPAITHYLVDQVNAIQGLSWTAEHSPRFRAYSIADARRVAGGTVMRGHRNFIDLPCKRRHTRHNPTTTTAFQAMEAATAEEAARGVGGFLRKGRAPEAFVAAAAAPLLQVAASSLASSSSSAAAAAASSASSASSSASSSGSDDIPDSFDAREAWPACAKVIGRVRDQSDCGSCWAFASTEAYNDRRCIKSLAAAAGGGEEAAAAAVDLTPLSAEDTTACCHGLTCGLSMGCNGGQPGSAWQWFTRKGVVSGGDYRDIGKGSSCKPYEFPPCAHHVDPASSGFPACPDGEYPTPSCVQECSEGDFASDYEADKRHASSAYSVKGVSDIQRDIMELGSVTAAFNVYADFLTYSGGVYEHVTGEYMGGHAVKVVGWGVDDASGKPYWLVVNSWNVSWGEGGLFRILRGENHCGIEGQIVAGEA